jgi:hypothetical protein
MGTATIFVVPTRQLDDVNWNVVAVPIFDEEP